MTAVVLVLRHCACARHPLLSKKLRQGGGCCGEREPAEKKVRVADRNRSHYPYHAVLKIDGMVCANARAVWKMPSIRMDGYWVRRTWPARGPNVHCKEKPDLGQLKEAVPGGRLYGAVCGMRRRRASRRLACAAHKRFSVCFV